MNSLPRKSGIDEIPCRGGEKWIIVWEDVVGADDPEWDEETKHYKHTAGIVGHHSIYGPMGVHPSEESALGHAKTLALNHPGAAFAVARVTAIVHAPEGFEGPKRACPGWKTVGDLYRTAGADSSAEATLRLLD